MVVAPRGATPRRAASRSIRSPSWRGRGLEREVPPKSRRGALSLACLGPHGVVGAPESAGKCVPGCFVGGGSLHTALVGSLPSVCAGLPCTCPSVTLRRRGPGPSSPSASAPRLAVGLGEGRPAALVFPGGLQVPRILRVVCAHWHWHWHLRLAPRLQGRWGSLMFEFALFVVDRTGQRTASKLENTASSNCVVEAPFPYS